MKPPTIRTAGLRPACRRDAGGPGSDPDGVGLRSRGYLPHIDAPDLVQHIVFRLADSLPPAFLAAIMQAPRRERAPAADALLDRGHGRRYLAVPAVAELVQNALLRFDQERYSLVSWCVMPNHVHALVLVAPGHELDQVVHSWKSYTAKQANRLLCRTGTFWAREYFDRFMRDDEQLRQTVAYIEGNPVKAGLCANISDWRFSSAWDGEGGKLEARLERRPPAGMPAGRRRSS